MHCGAPGPIVAAMNPLRIPFAVALAILFAACGDDKQAAAPASGAAAQAKDPAKDTGAQPPQQPAAPAAPKRLQPPKLDMTIIGAYFKNEPAAPKSDHVPTPEQAELGKALYHTAVPGAASCASCHDLAKYGQDGKPKSGARNTPTTLNAARQFSQFWDARSGTVEEALATGHGVADAAQLEGGLRAQKVLADAFAKAFPGQGEAVSARNYQLAIAAYLRTLVTKSPFDAFLDGDQKALTTEQKVGLKLFIDTGCTTCHTSRLVGANLLQKIGLLRPFPSEDLGRFAVSGVETDKHMFKVPQLLNIAHTAPYLHDGRLTSLAEVVQVMAQTQLNKDLSAADVDAIVAFLQALSGPVPEQALPR